MENNKDFDLNAIVLNADNGDGGASPRSTFLTWTITITISASAGAVTEAVKNCSMSSCKGAQC